jgi:hypothetical protein
MYSNLSCQCLDLRWSEVAERSHLIKHIASMIGVAWREAFVLQSTANDSKHLVLRASYYSRLLPNQILAVFRTKVTMSMMHQIRANGCVLRCHVD